MKKALLALGVCAIPWLAWLIFARGPNQVYLSDDTAAVEREILRVVPLQSDVTQAKATMEQNGFACTQMKDEEFATFVNGRQITHLKAKFLYCDREQGWIIQKRWQIAIVHRDNRVVEVHASYGLTGP